MKISDVFNLYNVNEYGIIENNGKFEGCMYFMPYFWEKFLNGLADEHDQEYIYFNLTDEDKKDIPEIEDYQQLRIYENRNGFVYGELL